MNAKAVPQGAEKSWLGASLGLVAAVVLTAGLVLVGPANAASPVKNGQIRACYKFKGKGKGTLRAVKGKRCRRGERRLTWSVAGPAGASGAAGAQGATGPRGDQGFQGNPGPAGSAGSAGAGTSVGSLETKVASLALEVQTLEGLLAGVKGGDLAGALAKLDGITGTQLNEAVGVVPTVSALVPKVSDLEGLLEGVGSGELSGALAKLDGVSGADLEGVVADLPTLQSTVSGLSTKTGELCGQAKELNEQTGLLGAAFGDIEVLSGLVTLGLPTVDGLDPFACTP